MRSGDLEVAIRLWSETKQAGPASISVGLAAFDHCNRESGDLKVAATGRSGSVRAANHEDAAFRSRALDAVEGSDDRNAFPLRVGVALGLG